MKWFLLCFILGFVLFMRYQSYVREPMPDVLEGFKNKPVVNWSGK